MSKSYLLTYSFCHGTAPIGELKKSLYNSLISLADFFAALPHFPFATGWCPVSLSTSDLQPPGMTFASLSSASIKPDGKYLTCLDGDGS